MNQLSTINIGIVNKAYTSLLSMKDSTSTMIIYILIILVILMVIIYLIHIVNLPASECANMKSLYGKLNGKIHSINTADPKCGYQFRD